MVTHKRYRKMWLHLREYELMINCERLLEKYPDLNFPELEEHTFRGNWDDFWTLYTEDEDILVFDAVGGDVKDDYFVMDYYKDVILHKS